MRHLAAGDPLRFQQLAGLVAQRESSRPLEHQRAVLPRGPGVVFAHPHPGVHRHATVRVGLAGIVQHDLAMITHRVVGKPDERQDQAAAERRVGGVGDVHLHLDEPVQPRLAVLRPFGREESRRRDRATQPLLRLLESPGQGVGRRGELEMMPQRILEQPEQRPAVIALEVVLVEEDHVGRELARRIVLRDTFAQSGEIGFGHQEERQPVRPARVVHAPEVMYPQDVVVPREPDRLDQLEPKSVVVDVPNAIAMGDGTLRRLTEEAVELLLLGILLRG